MTTSPDTVTEAVQRLDADGYDTPVHVLDGGVLRFSGAERPCPIDEAVVEQMFRFEGDSDPGDEMVVFGVLYPQCQLRGTLVSAFGPAADPDMMDHLTLLAHRYESS